MLTYADVCISLPGTHYYTDYTYHIYTTYTYTATLLHYQSSAEHLYAIGNKKKKETQLFAGLFHLYILRTLYATLPYVLYVPYVLYILIILYYCTCSYYTIYTYSPLLPYYPQYVSRGLFYYTHLFSSSTALHSVWFAEAVFTMYTHSPLRL
jgi:hypothetical protein